MENCIRFLTIFALGLFLNSFIMAEDEDLFGNAKLDLFGNAKLVGDPYYLSTDPVSCQPLGDHPKILQYNGRELRFAGDDTLAAFKKDPNDVITRLDKQMIADQLKNYPVQNCVVSDEKLGEMGEPINQVFHNRLLRFCCDSCPKRAEKKFADITAKLNTAVIEAQLSKYPLKECIVTGKPLDKDAINHVVGTRLVRLANKDALTQFNASPAKYLAKLDASH